MKTAGDRREYKRQWYARNKARILAGKEKTNQRRRERRAVNVEREREKDRLRRRAWRAKNPEFDARWRQNNRESGRAAAKRWAKRNPGYKVSRRKSCPQFRISDNLRARLNNALRGKVKTGSAVRDLGCSIREFRELIEIQFLPGMSWENYGKWHLDHVIPLSAFDLIDREQFLSACHWSNYQPLWAADNLSKSSRFHPDMLLGDEIPSTPGGEPIF